MRVCFDLTVPAKSIWVSALMNSRAHTERGCV